MSRLLIFAGTTEGRELAEDLERSGRACDICVATEYGETLIDQVTSLHTIHTGRLTAEEMERLIRGRGITHIVDATHPYAVIVSENIRKAAESAGAVYYRLLRESAWEEAFAQCPAMDSPAQNSTQAGTPRLVRVSSVREAVAFLSGTEGNILAVTGSKELHLYTELPDYRERVYARVLSTLESVQTAEKLGFSGKHLICMQGPFSEELNTAMLLSTGAVWMVTKESGKAGGFPEKVRAAARAGASLVVITRPEDQSAVQYIRGFSHEKNAQTTDFLQRGPQICAEEEAFGQSQKAGNSVFSPGEIREILAREGIYDPAAFSKQDLCDISHADNAQKSDISASLPRRVVSLIGIGMGRPENRTIEAQKACEEADVLIGAGRMLESAGSLSKPVYQAYLADDIFRFIRTHGEYRRIAVLLSGDVGFYSGARKLLDLLKEDPVIDVRIFSGISSVVYLCGQIGTSWEDVKLVSLHGRNQNLVSAVRMHQKVFALVGKQESFRSMCLELCEYGFGEVTVHAGCSLSYPEEKILKGTPEDLAHADTGDLVAVLIENSCPDTVVTHGLEDECFLRDNGESPGPVSEISGKRRSPTPMTKSEIRCISLSRLRLTRDSVIYDVGAGTGSVSIEMALQSSDGMVYAIEKKEEAANLIEQNQRKLKASNLKVIRGLAPEAMKDLPVPTHAFIGGSSGNMKEILSALLERNPSIRIVINAIALETVSEAVACIRELPVCDTDIVCVSVARSRPAAGYHLMTGQNPVYIISFTGSPQKCGTSRFLEDRI